jgi:hypothetical protein
MHCLVKSRYFIPPVWFAAFIWSHCAAHSFKVLACAGASAALATIVAATPAAVQKRLFMTVSFAGRARLSH